MKEYSQKMSEKIHGELPRFQFTSQQKLSHISTLMQVASYD
jgi:hypothetical protein